MSRHVQSKKELLIIGVHLKSDGYPNVKYRIRDLMQHEGLTVKEINIPMWTEKSQNVNGRRRLLRNFGRMLYSHMVVTIRLLIHKKNTTLYIPYPGIFILYFVSLVPFLKPKRIIVDAFISLYDTIVLDMRFFSPQNILSIFLKKVESRAYSLADMIVTDTRDSAEYFSSLFSLPWEKLISIPLSTDEEFFKVTPYSPSGTCRVLFIGTFSPLHNVDLIVEAAKLLTDHENICFRLIGDGQTAPRIQQYIKSHNLNVQWTRRWLNSAELASEIDKADICLGIFGSSDKARRVCPLKIYAYAACGRPIITANSPGMQNMCYGLDDPPFFFLNSIDPVELANAIKALSANPALRVDFAEKVEQFYRDQLANRYALQQLASLIY